MKKVFTSLVCLTLFSNLAFASNGDDAVAKIYNKFNASYKAAVSHAEEKMYQCPVITQDLLSMTLRLHTGAELRYSMNAKLYKLVAETSHIPLVVHNIASQFDWQYNQPLEEQLLNYQNLLKDIKNEFKSAEIEPHLKRRIEIIINGTNEFIQSVLERKKISQDEYAVLMKGLDGLIEQNLDAGARSQIEQFHHQMLDWQSAYPNENWQCLTVAIMATHGPRDGYVTKQYFQWLLNEPTYEQNVVYVEYPDVKDIFADKEKARSEAIQALASGQYQLELGKNVKDDPSYMQRDVMADSAQNILEEMSK